MTLEFRWPPHPNAARYRVTVRNVATGKIIGRIPALRVPQCMIPTDWQSLHAALRVEAAQLDGAANPPNWETWLPFFLIGAAEPSPVNLTAPVSADDFPLRIVVRSLWGDEFLHDETRRGSVFPIPEKILSYGPLRYSFLRYDHAVRKWIHLGRYQTLNCDAGSISDRVSMRRAQVTPPRADGPLATGVRPFLFTVDVESNVHAQRRPDPSTAVDEHIFGLTPGSESAYGIGYIMTALEEHGFKGTFFVDVLMAYQVGEKDARRVTDAILERGHDVQLHLHPNRLFFASDRCLRDVALAYQRTASVESFAAAMEVAVACFERYVGRPPVAFRNGSYIFKDSYWDVLRSFDIRVDSSLFAFKNSHVAPWVRSRTGPFRHPSGIVELPVTWSLLRSSNRSTATQHSLKGNAIDHAIASLWAWTPVPVVTLIHSFTLLEEQRCLSASDREEWCQQLSGVVDDEQYQMLAAYPPTVMYSGPSLRRIGLLHSRLDLVASTENARSFVMADLATEVPPHMLAEHQVEPLVECDRAGGNGRRIGVQRYSRSYLEAMLETPDMCC